MLKAQFVVGAGAGSLLLAACGAVPPAPARTPPAASSTPTLAVIPRAGENITLRGEQLIGSETFSDDGVVLKSRVRFLGAEHEVELSRRDRSVRCDRGPVTVLGANDIALVNGSWQMYLVAAEFASAGSGPKPVQVLLPCNHVSAAGSVSRVAEPTGTRVTVTVHSVEVEALFDGASVLLAAKVPTQGVTGHARVARPAPTTPAGTREESFTAQNGDVSLAGTLWLPPAPTSDVPVVLIIGGSGPTDRDGNNALGAQSDSYRLLAAALSERGIASLRYDKRGVGGSGRNFDPALLELKDYVADARAFLALLRADRRLGKLTLLGHSEGALIAELLASDAPCDAVVLVAGPGRPLDVILRAQLRDSVPAEALASYDGLVAALRAGRPLGAVPPELASIFSPSTARLLASAFQVEPVTQLGRVRSSRVTIIQGTTDRQVSVEDAESLARARKDATVTIIADMNHVLKVEPNASGAQRSYTDPSRPLAPGLVAAVATGVAR